MNEELQIEAIHLLGKDIPQYAQGEALRTCPPCALAGSL